MRLKEATSTTGKKRLKVKLKKNAKIEYVNPEYDPKAVQKGVQESINNSGEAAKKAKEAAEAKAKKK